MRKVGLIALVAVVLAVAAPAGRAATTTVTVDVASPVGRIQRSLGGLNWSPGRGDTVADLRPPLMRLDAYLDKASPTPDVLDLSEVHRHLADVRAIGAEPLVILSYMPPWLGEPRAYGRDPTRIAPADMQAWEDLVYRAVRELATADAPAYRFEAWNEPDVPVFWQDLPTAWVDTVERTARAVARVERDTGLDLQFGGPATAMPDPVYLAAFLERFRDPTLPLDFVSWHYYGNYPFLGPDGREPIVPSELDPAFLVVGRQNPVASPSSYGEQIDLMRQWTAAALAGSERPMPALVLDEWNLSAAGWDKRHDTNEGAAFAAATLIEMQDADLDAAAYFRAADVHGVAGEHGLVTMDGTRKPAWWTFDLWRRLAWQQVAVSGAQPADGLWAVASRRKGAATVLLASFSASRPTDRTIDVDVTAADYRKAVVRRLDGSASRASVVDGRVTVDLPAQSAVFIELKR